MVGPRLSLSLWAWCWLVATCWAQHSADMLLAQNPCSSKTMCSDCIRTKGCSWCFMDDFNGPRCFNQALEGGTAGCDEAFMFNPMNSPVIPIEYDKELSRTNGLRGSMSYEESMSKSSSGAAAGEFGAAAAAGGGGSGSGGENLVQIKPQKVELKLRMHETQKVTFQYSQAQDYPVDLYYLMDLSKSMQNDKEKLSALGNLLSSTMKNITSNFRIGFGSFVDKLVMPYVSTVPKNLISPCDGCAAPYGFRNQMTLSTDTDSFEQAVTKADVSGNLDSPEGGFDAIMQAIVCQREIGWREKARRLLVFSTDAGFHYAGDGKLGGIVQPNDGMCHMERDVYTHSTIQDYPSISQINLKVKEHAINVIFAVTYDQINVYEQLSSHIEGSSSGVLSNDSGNVVDLVREQYNKIRSTVEMKDTSSNFVKIVYYSSCLGDPDKVNQTNKCDGLKVGDLVTFTAEVTLDECPKDPAQWKQTFQIYPVGVAESLTVDLEMICDCPCEHPDHFSYKNSPERCNGHGIYACGVCMCEAGRFGKRCECSPSQSVSVDQERGCRPANDTDGPLCSNRGTCVCGVCDCQKMEDSTKVISGMFCDCDNFSCDMYKGNICSGPSHGECVCGKCSCQPGFTGPACQCLLDQEPCRSPENNLICSGHGQCVCGHCECMVDEERRYFGKFCEKCPTCPGKCNEFKDCVLCEVHHRGKLYNPKETEALCGNCALNPYIEKGKIEVNETRNEHLCSFYDDEDCLYVYVYSFIDTRLLIRAQKERECPHRVPMLGIVLGVIAAIVLVGLALLMLWKMVTTIHDRREFARFEKERMMAKWDTGENPIYKQATSTFKNPTYAGK